MSREWVYENIFEFNQHEKESVFNGIIEDRKQQFRMDQIEQEGTDPAQQGVEPSDDVEEQSDDWGGDRRSGTAKKEYGNEYKASDIKDATKYERERYGKREFKGKSPLAMSKGATVVASENLLNQLKDKFGAKTKGSILSEEILIDDDKE